MENLRGKAAKLFSLVLSFIVAISIAGIVYAPVTLPSLYIDPEANTANPNGYFDVNLNIADVVDLFSWGVKLSFDPNVLEVAYYYVGITKVYNITQGPFLQGQPGGTSFVSKAFITYVQAGCTTLGAYPGVDGSGTLMTITFHVKDSGKSALALSDTKLYDSTITAIDHTASDGYFYTGRADLLARSAWPSYHHFDVSKSGPNQGLNAKVKNLASVDLYVQVRFEIVRDDAFVTTVTTSTIVATPDVLYELSADFGPLTDADAGKYYVSATAWYSWTGFYYTQGEKLKTFSFAVVP